MASIRRTFHSAGTFENSNRAIYKSLLYMKRILSKLKPGAKPNDRFSHGPSFGVALVDLLRRDREVYGDQSIEVPIVFQKLAEFLESEDRLKTEGLLRLSGSLKSVNELKEALDRGKC
jgi:hypothetical protein